MSILNKAIRGRVARPQKVVIYAPEGFGKSTLASQFPDPLFLDVEGSTAQLDVIRLGRDVLTDLKAFESALDETAKTAPCATLVTDTADWLEQMAADDIIAAAGNAKITGIEDFGYGKGYTILRERVTLLLAKFDRVIQSGINVVLLAHSKVTKFEPPDGAGPFDRYELKLSKQVAPLIKEWADMLLFGNWRTQVREKDKGDSGQQFKGVGGKERLLHCVRCAAWDAKNRHGMADTEKWEIATIQNAFAAVGAPWGRNATTAPVAAVTSSEGKEEPKQPPADALPSGVSAAAGTPANTPGQAAGTAPESAAGSLDVEIARVINGQESAVNGYLVERRKIKEGQTWRNADEPYKARILKNPAGFLKLVTSGEAAAK